MEAKPLDDIWYWFLTGEKRETFPKLFGILMDVEQFVYRWLPGRPRCLHCSVPLAGPGNFLLKPIGIKPSIMNPHICGFCEGGVLKDEGGAEIELTMLFADVRDSTPLAESTSTTEFRKIIQRFYKVTTDVLIRHNALVNRLMGDQVSALFVPRFTGRHAEVAIHAASELLRVTGHGDPNGPWVPVGVGVHTGRAYVGTVGSPEGVNEITVLGSAANLAARLSSKAATGEILVSDQSMEMTDLDTYHFETRSLALKGISQPVSVRVIQSKVVGQG